jgi:hypothetical protein
MISTREAVRIAHGSTCNFAQSGPMPVALAASPIPGYGTNMIMRSIKTLWWWAG